MGYSSDASMEFGRNSTTEKSDSLTLFGEFLQDSAGKGKIPVLFIDEAQLLKPDMLGARSQGVTLEILSSTRARRDQAAAR